LFTNQRYICTLC